MFFYIRPLQFCFLTAVNMIMMNGDKQKTVLQHLQFHTIDDQRYNLIQSFIFLLIILPLPNKIFQFDNSLICLTDF